MLRVYKAWGCFAKMRILEINTCRNTTKGNNFSVHHKFQRYAIVMPEYIVFQSFKIMEERPNFFNLAILQQLFIKVYLSTMQWTHRFLRLVVYFFLIFSRLLILLPLYRKLITCEKHAKINYLMFYYHYLPVKVMV